MKKVIVLFIAITIIIGTTGCATIFYGNSDKVTFNSSPPGADIYINNKNTNKQTPADINVVKEKYVKGRAYKYELKKDGYVPFTSKDAARLKGLVIFDCFCYGVPALIDVIAGRQYKYKAVKNDELIKLNPPLESTNAQNKNETKEITNTDGKLNGVKKEYYTSGKLKSETSWVDNQMNGMRKEYYENGNLKQETPWVGNQINGVQKTYYESGQLHKVTPYTDNVVSGVVKTYDENGILREATKNKSETTFTSTTVNNETNPTKYNTQQTNKTEEPVYRGNGDPLKGLNVSKPKEITSGNYYALIIGIDKYTGQWKPLNTAVNDAQAFESVLRTKYKLDKFYTLYNAAATRQAIMNALENLVNTLTEDDNVVIYYSGHGDLKKTMNKGYWIPADATTDAVSNLISNNDIQTFLASIKTKHTLLISDACFSGDIFRGNTVSVPFEESEKYYTKVYNKLSRQALTSGDLEPVMDGGKDGHSVFSYYLLKSLTNNTNKYFDAGSLYNNLKIPVVNNSDQTPHLDPIKNTGDEG
ncbi:MAG: caspase family protein, partial [Bacteroidia bacterium]